MTVSKSEYWAPQNEREENLLQHHMTYANEVACAGLFTNEVAYVAHAHVGCIWLHEVAERVLATRHDLLHGSPVYLVWLNTLSVQQPTVVTRQKGL